MALPTFPSFDISADSGAPGPRWKQYIARFRNLVIALNITDKNRQKALLLHYGGDEVNDVFDTLTITEAGEDESPIDKAIDALSAYFKPKQNVAYEEYQFRDSETIMAYYTRLKHLAQNANLQTSTEK